eukprot:529292_1
MFQYVDVQFKIKVVYIGDGPFTASICGIITHSGIFGHLRETVILTKDDSVTTDGEWTFKLKIEWCGRSVCDKLEGIKFYSFDKWSTMDYDDLDAIFYTHHHWIIHKKCMKDIDEYLETNELDNTIKNRKAAAKYLHYATYDKTVERTIWYQLHRHQ